MLMLRWMHPSSLVRGSFLWALLVLAGLLVPVRAHAQEGPSVWLDSVVLLVTGPAWCSGAVLDGEGTVLTAYHCVANGQRPQVRTRNGDRYKARVVATSPRRDVALLEVPDLAGKLAPLKLRDTELVPGEVAWGLGHPYAPQAEQRDTFAGTLQWSVTRGVVSAVGDRFVQVDTPLNPGNSGGPVVDGEGRIMGVASRKLDADNIAFIAPWQAVRDLLVEPRKRVLGGTLALNVTSLMLPEMGAAPTVGAMAQVSLRDRLVLDATAFVPMQQRWMAVQHGASRWVGTEVQAWARLPLGRGMWSTTVDAGGGLAVIQGLEATWGEERVDLTFQAPALAPDLGARFGVGGGAVRVLWLPTEDEVMIGFDLGYPGVVSTF